MPRSGSAAPARPASTRSARSARPRDSTPGSAPTASSAPRPAPRRSASGPTRHHGGPARARPPAGARLPTRCAPGSTRPSCGAASTRGTARACSPPGSHAACGTRSWRRACGSTSEPRWAGSAPAPPHRGDARRHGQGRRWGARDERLGPALEALQARDHRPGLLHRAHGTGARAARGDRLDERHRRLGLQIGAPLRAHDARRPDRVRHRRDAAGPRPPHRPALRLRRGLDPGRDRRPAPDVPDVRRRADRGRVGRADRRRADHLPFFGTLEQGNVHYGLGYTGNGVGPSHLGGRILANRALANYDDVLALPIVDLEPRRFPPEPIRSLGAMVANLAIHRRDEALDDGAIPTRSSTSWRSSRGASGTTSARDPACLPPRHTSPGGWRRRASRSQPGADAAPRATTRRRRDPRRRLHRMWTAWFLKERDPACDVVLLEADELCGGGPSGRNGGFCYGMWEDLETLVRLFGDIEAPRVSHVGPAKRRRDRGVVLQGKAPTHGSRGRGTSRSRPRLRRRARGPR